MKIFVETDRLVLRELLDTDIEGMFALDSDAEVHKYLGNNPIKTMDEAQKNIDYIRMQYEKYGIGRWAAIEKSSGDFIGWTGLKMNFENEMNEHTDFIDVGYRFIKKYWGKGYATESGKASVQYGFDRMGYKTIYGMAELENTASRNALLKIGLTHINDFIYEPENLPLAWYKIRKP